jgi:hypothetical protein
MKKAQRLTSKKSRYPETTAGSSLASKVQKLASRLTAKQRQEHFNDAMVMILEAEGGA